VKLQSLHILTALIAMGAAAVDAPAQMRNSASAIAGADTGTVAYDVEGIHVIHRRLGTGEIVVANLYLLGGVRQVTASNAGIELLLLESSERGTKSYSRDRLRRSMAQLGTKITTSVGVDWSSIGVQATRSTLDSTWRIFASRVMEPQFDETEVGLLKRQLLSGVRQRQDSPDLQVDYLADSFAFKGHPYQLQPSGTESSLSNITVQDLQRYQESQMVKSRMLLVVVGDVSKTQVERLIRGSLAKLPAGSYRWTLPDTLPRDRAAALTVNRPLPTNYILGLYAGPRADSKDYHALRIATAILSGQLFSEIRSRRNLTYAVDAPFIEHAVSAGGLYVTTVDPKTTLEVGSTAGGFPCARGVVLRRFPSRRSLCRRIAFHHPVGHPARGGTLHARRALRIHRGRSSGTDQRHAEVLAHRRLGNAEQLPELRGEEGVGRNSVEAQSWLAVPVGEDAPGLLDDRDERGHVPWAQAVVHHQFGATGGDEHVSVTIAPGPCHGHATA
jgi:zinc protease